ncbi:hypothetical protein AMQ83_28955, partial [Paenibacillus riograndensis]
FVLQPDFVLSAIQFADTAKIVEEHSVIVLGNIIRQLKNGSKHRCSARVSFRMQLLYQRMERISAVGIGF